jgi:hypothetical protein
VARIEDPYGLHDSSKEPLRVGTFVNANIEGRELANIITLPRYVLRAGNFVWVVDESMHLRNRKVTLLRTGGDSVYVSAGLDEGDLVSLTRLDSSFDGSRVHIQSSTPSNLLDQHGNTDEKITGKLSEATAAVDPQAADVTGG